MVIVDYLTKLAHFIHIKDNTSINQLDQMYIHQIMRLHGVPKIIVLDRDMRFVSTF